MIDLVPVFRTPQVAALLRLLLADGGEWTADDLTEQSGIPYATVTREIRRLERAGVVTTEIDGRTKFLTANTSDPAIRALARAVKLGSLPKGGDPVAKKKDKKKGKKKKK